MLGYLFLCTRFGSLPVAEFGQPISACGHGNEICRYSVFLLPMSRASAPSLSLAESFPSPMEGSDPVSFRFSPLSAARRRPPRLQRSLSAALLSHAFRLGRASTAAARRRRHVAAEPASRSQDESEVRFSALARVDRQRHPLLLEFRRSQRLVRLRRRVDHDQQPRRGRPRPAGQHAAAQLFRRRVYRAFLSDEIPIPGMTLYALQDIQDVTKRVVTPAARPA